jgi:SAM-dependent methyltransferase
MNPNPAPSLIDLYGQRSKHSHYQQLHPSLRPWCGAVAPTAQGKLEAARQAYFEATLPLRDARVLDIGANTGYFSFGALAAGARAVHSYEGNAEHAGFLRTAADALGVGERLEVTAGYYDFASDATPFDIVYCLNVLHHLGDDFGDRRLGMAQARERMQGCLRHLSSVTGMLVLQTGFNWRGDRHRPLYGRGLKCELVAHVREMCAGDWCVEEIVVVDPQSLQYRPLDAALEERFDALGEFMNRPMFRLRSRHRA